MVFTSLFFGSGLYVQANREFPRTPAFRSQKVEAIR